MGSLTIYQLGCVEYEDGLQLQKVVGEARARAQIGDALLLLEHPPVLTLGRGASGEHIVASREALMNMGVEVFETNRGGDVTYHGPGQLVGYPILQLPPDRHDVRRYVHDLEEVLIRCLAHFGITAGRVSGWTGVWVRTGAGAPEKIAAIGVHLSRWQTSHGFALNVNTQLAHFGLIVPCGIREAGVTSMERLLGHSVHLTEVRERCAQAFAEVFGMEWVESPSPLRTVSIATLRPGRSGPEVLLLRRVPARGGYFQVVTGKVEPGETPRQAAIRELREETGAQLEVRPLDYQHSFALAEQVMPRIAEETAFAAQWQGSAPVVTDPAEHDLAEWVDVPEALRRLPYRGLKVAVERAVASMT